MPIPLHDAQGVEHEVLTRRDLNDFSAKLFWRFGGGAIALIVAGTVIVTNMRRDIADTQVAIARIETEGSKPVRLLQASLAQVQTELAQTRALLQEVRDELRTRRP